MPFNKECFLTDSPISLNDKGVILLWVLGVHIEPLLNHEIVFL